MHRQLTAGLIAALVALAQPAAAAPPSGLGDRDLFGQADGNVAIFNDDSDDQLLSGGFGYNLRLGWRWTDHLGAFLQGGQAAWFATGLRRQVVPGVLNVGAGFEYRFFDGRLRSSAAAGSSTLLFDTTLDPAGRTGWFANIRPAGLRWGIAPNILFELNPVTFMVMQPVTTGVKLTKVEYQTVLALEFQ